MPLYDVGYRSWEGQKASTSLRWLAIAITGVQVAFRSSWLSRTLIVSWIPALVFGVGFFVYEQSISQPQLRQFGGRMLILSGASESLVQAAMSDPAEARHEVWSALLMGFFRYPQAVLMVIVVGIVAPRLISFDLRNRGYLLYFSRPISIWEYIVGKGAVVCTFLAIITTLPALVLYCIGLGFASESSAVVSTWDLPVRVVLASLVLWIPTISVALACSAMTIESRYAAFAWFSVWVVGWVTYFVLSIGDFANQMNQVERNRRGDDSEMVAVMSYQSTWEVLSPYHVLGRIQQWVFGLLPGEAVIVPHIIVLSAVTAVSLLVVHRRIRLRLVA